MGVLKGKYQRKVPLILFLEEKGGNQIEREFARLRRKKGRVQEGPRARGKGSSTFSIRLREGEGGEEKTFSFVLSEEGKARSTR